MAKQKLPENERMVAAPTKLPPDLLAEVKQLANDRQWKPAHAIRFLVIKGLESLKTELAEQRERATAA